MRKEIQPREQWKPSMFDANLLEEGMARFPVTVINGKKQYPFEQYCADKGYISFTDDGEIMVRSVFNWTRACDTYELAKWKREKDMEKIFELYPEERVAYASKISDLFKDVKGLLSKLKTAVT